MKKVLFFLVSCLVALLMSDLSAQNYYNVTNTDDSGPGSLRDAVLAANNSTETPFILFDISAGSTIQLQSRLPNLNKAGLVIDGSSAPGYAFSGQMVTLNWNGTEDCIRSYANNITIRGLAFTNDGASNGDAAIRPYEGSNLQIQYCSSYNQNKGFVVTNGGTGVKVTHCVVENFINDGSAHVFRVNSGGITLIANCTITNIPRKVFELNNSSAAVTTIRDNVIINVGYENNSSQGGISAHAFDIENVPTRMVIRNNFINGCKSKFVEINRGSAMVERRDSIFYNTVLNCTGQHGIYIGGKASSYPYIGYNYFDGDGGVYNMDQIIEFYYAQYGRVWGNVIKNSKARGFMARDTDGTLIRNNVMYNLSGNHAIELNDDCDNVVIRGNILGTDSLSSPGLSIFTNAVIALNNADNCIIGGTIYHINGSQGNQIIASNGERAITIGSSCEGTTIVQGNDLNVSSDGLICLTNSTNDVIEVNGSAVQIGGDMDSFRNRIAGKGNRGIYINTLNSVIEGNLIGCTDLGLPIDGNAMYNAIYANEGNLTIGSKTNPELRNKIGYNINAIYNSGENNVCWSGNEYWNNTGTSVLSGGIQAPTIAGGSLPATVNGTALPNARVEIYHWDPATEAQGYEYLGHTTTDGSGNWSFTASEPFTNQIAALQIDNLDGSGFVSWDGLPIFPPVANHDYSENNVVGSNASLNILLNDFLYDGSPATSGLVTVDIDPGTSGNQSTLNIAGEGSWTYEPSTGNLSFDPEPGFTTDPAHILYSLTENSSGFSDNAVVVVTYNEVSPLAIDDESLNNPAGSNVTINILANDLMSDGSNVNVQLVAVDIDANAIGIQNIFVTPGEGTWSYNESSGDLAFSPSPGNYTVSPVQYKLIETLTGLYDEATVTISYEIFPPEANDDLSEGNYFGGTAVIGILENDILLNGSSATPEFVTVDIDQTTAGTQSSLVVDGEGTWSYNFVTGNLIFAPEIGFYNDPNPIIYALMENGTGLYDEAEVTVNYIEGVDINPPQNLVAGVFNTNSVLLSWDPPSFNSGAFINWDDGNNHEGIGLTDGGTFSVAARWIPEQLAGYDGYNLTNVRFFPRGYTPVSITLKVWSGENASNLIVSQPLTNVSMNQWNSILLDTPVSMNVDEELWVGYTITDQPIGIFPAGCDDGPAVKGFGDKISLDGTTWGNLKDYGFDYNWNIQAILEVSEGTNSKFEPLAQNNVSYQNPSNELSVSEQPTINPGAVKNFPVVTGYQIFKEGEFLQTVGANPTSYIDPDLPDGNYTYQVSTVYDLGVSFPSEPVEASLPGGMGPEILIDPMVIDEVHPNPPEITTMQVAVTNTGSSVLNLNLEIAPLPSDKTLINQQNEGMNIKPIPTPIEVGNSPWHAVKLDPSMVAPATKGEEVIRYDDGENYGAIGISDPTDTFEAAAYFPASTMANYTGMIMTQMQVFFWDIPFFLKIKVYGPGSSTEPGDLIYEQQVSSNIPDHAWTTFTLGEGVLITGEDLWIGYEVGQFTATDFPAGFDAGPAVSGYGDMNKLNGEWATMTSYGFDFNWNIAGVLVDQLGVTNWLSALPFEESINPNETKNIELTFNSEGLPLGVYEALLKFNSNDINNPIIDLPVSLNVGDVSLPPVTDLMATVTENDVLLTWTVPSEKNAKDLLGYKIYRDFEFLEEVTLNEYLDENLISGTYEYYVTAIYDYGQSDPSNTAEAIILPSGSDPHIVIGPSYIYETHLNPPEITSLEFDISNAGEIALDYNIEVVYNAKKTPAATNPKISTGKKLSTSKIKDKSLVISTGNTPVKSNYASKDDQIIRYDNGEFSTGIGVVSTATIGTAIYFPADTMWQYNGMYLDKVEFYINDKPLECKVLIYGPGTATSPGEIIHEQEVEVLQNSWNLIDLDIPILLDGEDLWIGYNALHNGGQSPCGTDEGPAVAMYGDWFNIDGGSWTILSINGINRNWNLAGYITGEPVIEWLDVDPVSGTLNQNQTESITLTFKSQALDPGVYEASVIFSSNDPLNPEVILPVYLDVGGNGTIPPSNLSGSVSENDIHLEWEAPEGNNTTLQGYNIYRDGINVDFVASPLTEYDDINLEVDSYEYFVTAVYDDGESLPTNSIALEILPPVLYPPSNLQGNVNGNDVNLVWLAPTGSWSTLHGYNIYRDDLIIGYVVAPDTEYNDLNLSSGSYDYYVTAVYEDGQSVPSNIITLEIEPSVLYPPINLQGTIAGNDVNLTWTEPTGYVAVLEGYYIYRDGDNIDYVTYPTTTYNDPELLPGIYEYYVTALYDEGESVPSNIWVTDTITNIQEPGRGNIRVFPNPAKEHITVIAPDEIEKIILYDITGQKLLDMNEIGSEKSFIDLQNFKSGVYYLTINTRSGGFSLRIIVL
ncbi:MAG: T9SS type A sorting domain-containing protein [Bacteroidales bacterium]|nr:T9SS type A sorting domain-containing protein [Bacteroidales bacterium]MCF8405861.1 T9SS type A sorting domain-containing protein [Bacteroidales bacterium]